MFRLDHRMVFPPTAQSTHVTLSPDPAFSSWPYLDQSTTENTRMEVLEIGSGYVQPNYLSTNVSTSQEKQETQTNDLNNMIMYEQGCSLELGSELIARHKNVSVSKLLKESCSQRKLKPTPSTPKSLRKSPSADSKLRREKANEREKQRIVVLKHALNVLKNAIPAAREKTKVTKLEILKLAREYINSLKELLEDNSTQEENDNNDASLSEPFFGEKDLFVYCNDSQWSNNGKTKANSWDSAVGVRGSRGIIG